MESKIKKFILPLFYTSLVLAAIILGIITFFDRTLMRTALSHGGYYLILLLVILWVVTLLECFRRHKSRLTLFMRNNWRGFLISFILSAVIFISVRPAFRMLSDETNLVSSSRSMFYEKRIDIVKMGKWYYDRFHPIRRAIPKRPLIFPFLAHVLHGGLGYRAENAFTVNFLILFSLFSLVYIVLKKPLGNLWAISAMMLVAAQPIVSQSAASAGYDLLAALFAIIVLISLKWFLESPSALRFQMLWINLLVFSNIRYEGILVFAIVISFLALFKHIKMDFFKTGQRLIYFCTPLVLLVTFWQQMLVKNQFEADGAAFAIAYFFKNNMIFLKSMFDYDFFLPYASVVNLLGVLSIFYLGYRVVSSRVMEERNKRHFVFISSAVLFVIWAIYTSFHKGAPDAAFNSRYYILFCVLLSVSTVITASQLGIFRQRSAYFLALSIAVFMCYHPVAVEGRHFKTLISARKYKFVLGFLKREAEVSRDFLIIDRRPAKYIVHNYGAVDFEYANTNESIAEGYRDHRYEDLFVVQDIAYKTSEPTKETRLHKKFKLKKLIEIKKSSRHFIRISKVVSIQG